MMIGMIIGTVDAIEGIPCILNKILVFLKYFLFIFPANLPLVAGLPYSCGW